MRIKICGNVRPTDVQMVADFGPDYMGWILSPASPRRVELRVALRLVEGVRSRRPEIRHVAVMARNDWREYPDLMRAPRGAFDFVQCVDAPYRLRPTRRLVPALRVRSLLEDHQFARFGPSAFAILDSYVPGKPGGTGTRFPPEWVGSPRLPFLVAGGVSVDNLAQVWSDFPLAFGVDVSSGLEESPGRKSEGLLERFFELARSLPTHPEALVPGTAGRR